MDPVVSSRTEILIVLIKKKLINHFLIKLSFCQTMYIAEKIFQVYNKFKKVLLHFEFLLIIV